MAYDFATWPPNRLHMAQDGAQEASKMAQEASKMAQETPKTHQDEPRDAEIVQKTIEKLWLLLYF